MHLSWKVLLTEAKTQFGIQKCKVRACRIMKIEIKQDPCRKIRVKLMHLNLTFLKIRVNLLRALLISYNKVSYHAGYTRMFCNGPFPSCCEPHYKSEAKCKVFIMIISFHSYANKTNFQMETFALSLAFIIRFIATRKWSILFVQRLM